MDVIHRDLEQRIYHGQPTPLRERVFQNVFFSTLAGAMQCVRPFVTEEIVINGFKEIIVDQEKVKPPYVLLLQHNSWLDFVNLFPLWFDFPTETYFTGPLRTNYFPKHPFLNSVIDMLTGTLFFHIYRTSSEREVPAQKMQEMQKANAGTVRKVVAAYAHRLNIAMAPEGTTKGDGRISPIKSGTYHYSHFIEEGINYVVPCIPVGNTYDFLSGDSLFGRQRQRIFLNFGAPFTYAPITPQEKENDFQKRDKEAFNEKVRDAYLDLNTVTVSQLGALFIYENLKRGENAICFDDLYRAISKHAENIGRVPGIFIDNELRESTTRLKRAHLFFSALQDLGYIIERKGMFYINRERALSEPLHKAEYKKENILLYTVHKIEEIALERPSVGYALGFL